MTAAAIHHGLMPCVSSNEGSGGAVAIAAAMRGKSQLSLAGGALAMVGTQSFDDETPVVYWMPGQGERCGCFGCGARRYCEGGSVPGSMALGSVVMGVDDGLPPGEGGVHGEQAFEGEDGHLEEVEGEPGDDAGEGEGDDDADQLVVLA